MPISKEKKLAIITGAAQGIGKVIAETLMLEGIFVVLTDINEEVLLRTIAEFHTPGLCSFRLIDVSDPKIVDISVRDIINEHGQIDILINNAAIAAFGTIEDTDLGMLDKILDVNFKGTYYMCQAVARHMKKRRSGKILNVSSITSKRGDNTTSPAYGSSKGAVNVLTKSLAKELGPFGINVNAVAPHAIDTPIMKLWDDDKKVRAGQSLPIGRIGTPADVAYAVSFLVSDKASYITGQILNVDGGHFMDS